MTITCPKCETEHDYVRSDLVESEDDNELRCECGLCGHKWLWEPEEDGERDSYSEPRQWTREETGL